MNINAIFSSGLEPEEYVRNLRNYRKLVRDLYAEVTTPEPWASKLKSAVDTSGKSLRMTVMTEDWCGDSACNIPVLATLSQASRIPLRVFRGSEYSELKELYESQGTTHIPVVSIWDASGSEIFRWVERPDACAAPADEWKSGHPEFYPLYEAEDTESKKQFARLYREFLETMANWYRDGLWSETAREITEGLSDALTSS